MAQEDIPKAAIITPFGLFEFLRMPFGLKNAAQVFQRLMDGILRNVSYLQIFAIFNSPFDKITAIISRCFFHLSRQFSARNLDLVE